MIADSRDSDNTAGIRPQQYIPTLVLPLGVPGGILNLRENDAPFRRSRSPHYRINRSRNLDRHLRNQARRNQQPTWRP